MTGLGSSGRYTWHEGDAFAELVRLGDQWQVTYGFEATPERGRIIHAQRTTPDYEDAVRQMRQVIGYYFAEPEHAERVRRELLAAAGLDPGESRYLPVPDNKYLTPAGGGASATEQVEADRERRARALRGEPEPVADTPQSDDPPPERSWWKRRWGRRSQV